MKNVNYVDPMIGTVGDEKAFSSHDGGKTHPGACTPGGMVQVSPDTVTGGDNGTGYNYCHNTIEGFSINHMSGIGWYGDLGNLQIMPVIGDTDLRSGSNKEIPFTKGELGWKSSFSHEKELARAGYYAVELERYSILAKIKLDPKYHTCKVSTVFAIECSDNPLDYPYIHRMYLNGEEVLRPFLTFAEITAGGILQIHLSKEPSYQLDINVPETFLEE